MRAGIAGLLALCGAALAMPAIAGEMPPIRFKPQRSSATVSDAVVRGDRNSYRVNARAGQTMSVRITSLEHNAVLTIYAPGGTGVAGAVDEITRWTGKLTASGDYLIVVGGTRGNADYTLTVAIR